MTTARFGQTWATDCSLWAMRTQHTSWAYGTAPSVESCWMRVIFLAGPKNIQWHRITTWAAPNMLSLTICRQQFSKEGQVAVLMRTAASEKRRHRAQKQIVKTVQTAHLHKQRRGYYKARRGGRKQPFSTEWKQFPREAMEWNHHRKPSGATGWANISGRCCGAAVIHSWSACNLQAGLGTRAVINLHHQAPNFMFNEPEF